MRLGTKVGLWREPYLKNCTESLPSPFPLLSWVPRHATDLVMSDQALRDIIRRAAQYHGVPQSLMAALLQNENNPNASTTLQIGQLAERTAQGLLNGFDHIARRLFGRDADDIPELPKDLDDKARQFIRGSAGITNMSDATLNSAIEYTLGKYCKNPIADSDRYAIFGIDCDVRITGYDVYADLYYCAAHIRQNIDVVMGTKCYRGSLTDEEFMKTLGLYNSGISQINSYARDGLKHVKANHERTGELYFYG